MTKQVINVGTEANDKKGDSLRAAFQKVNTNFTELYTALGLDSNGLNLGAFEFTGSILTTTDSSPIVIDQATTITSDLTVGGDIVPSTNLGSSLGSPTQQFKSLYVSTNTIYINNVPLSLDGSNNILVNNTPISTSIEYTSIPNAPTDVADLTDNTGLLAVDTGVVRFDTNTIYTAASQNLVINPSNDELNKIVIPGAGNGGDYPLSLTNTEGSVTLTADTMTWAFNPDGSINLPSLSNTGYETGYDLNGPTLRLGVPTSQTIITGPAPTSSNRSAQRLVIQGQKGYGDGDGAGEGGDIYLWGGVGGEGASGGDGGDIKVRGGAGQNGGGGGYVKVEGGDSQVSGDGSGGYVEITGGNSYYGGNGNGGNISVRAGTGNGTGSNGRIEFYTNGFNNQWQFNTDATTKFPYDVLKTRQDAPFYIDAHDTGENVAAVVIRNLNDVEEWITSQISVGIPNVGITAGVTKNWTFDSNGNTQFPGDVIKTRVDERLHIDVYDDQEDYASINLRNWDLNEDQVTAQLTVGRGDVGITAGVTNNWTFNADGSLTVPPNGIIGVPDNTGGTGGYIQFFGAGGEGGDDNTSTTSGNIDIVAGVDSGEENDNIYGELDIGNIRLKTRAYTGQPVKEWKFGWDGSLTFPSGAGFVQGDNGQLKTNDGTTLTLDFRDTSGRGLYTNDDGFSLRGNGTYTWKFDTAGNLTLPAGGDIFASDGVTSVLGGSTGNIGFVTDYLYDFNGITIENADLSHGATAAVIVPANGNSTNPIHLNNLYGGVRVSAGISGSTKSWSFNANGTIGFPSNTIKTPNSLSIQIPTGSIPTGVANWNGQGGWNQGYYSNVTTTGGTGSGLTVNVAAGGGGYINISAISIATPGTGYTNGDVITIDNENNLPGTFTVVIPENTWSFGTDGTLTFPDATVQTTAFTTSPTLNVLKIDDGVHEKFQSKADATGTVTHDCSSGHIFYHTSPDANWTANFTNLSLSATYATSVTLIITQGGTGYYPSAVQIGGSAQTINWQGNTTPTPSVNRKDVVTFSIICTATDTYTVLGQLTGF